jgi:hypothetical protein
MGAIEPVEQSLWPSLYQLWKSLPDLVDSQETKPSVQNHVLSLARFTRNLIAGVMYNQEQA